MSLVFDKVSVALAYVRYQYFYSVETLPFPLAKENLKFSARLALYENDSVYFNNSKVRLE